MLQCRLNSHLITGQRPSDQTSSKEPSGVLVFEVTHSIDNGMLAEHAK
jgi:hypothetical protein